MNIVQLIFHHKFVEDLKKAHNDKQVMDCKKMLKDVMKIKKLMSFDSTNLNLPLVFKRQKIIINYQCIINYPI